MTLGVIRTFLWVIYNLWLLYIISKLQHVYDSTLTPRMPRFLQYTLSSFLHYCYRVNVRKERFFWVFSIYIETGPGNHGYRESHQHCSVLSNISTIIYNNTIYIYKAPGIAYACYISCNYTPRLIFLVAISSYRYLTLSIRNAAL